MIDRTQEDINQDVKIDALQHHVGVLEDGARDVRMTLKGLVDQTNKLEQKIEAALQLIVSQTTLFGQHEAKLKELNPLTTLLEHVEAIKEHLK